MLIPCLQVVSAASPSQPESPSCSSLGVQRPQEKKEAPAFSLNDLDGKQVSLSDFRGKPVLIVFWATWCDTCKEEMPVLEKFSQGKRDQLVILFITIDGERKTRAQKIINQNKITLPVLLSVGGKGDGPIWSKGLDSPNISCRSRRDAGRQDYRAKGLGFRRSVVLYERTIQSSLTNNENCRIKMLIISFQKIHRLWTIFYTGRIHFTNPCIDCCTISPN